MHAENVSSRSVAEQLSKGLFVIRNPVLFDEGNEIGGSVACQQRLREMRIAAEEILRSAIKIGEITAAATRDQDFLSDAVCPFEDDHTSSALAGLDGAHQSGSTSSEDENVTLVGRGQEKRIPGKCRGRWLSCWLAEHQATSGNQRVRLQV